MSKQSSTSLTWVFAGAALVVGLMIGAVGVSVLMSLGDEEVVEDAGSSESGGAPPASVMVGLVEVRTLQNRVPIIGRLQEVRRVTVTAEVEGKVMDMAVGPGSLVTGGETTLVKIDDVWAKLTLKSAEAELAVAQAELNQARADLKQLEKLAAANSAKAKEVDDQRTTLASMEARLSAAATAKERAEVGLNRSVVIAPFDGAVTQKLVEVGQWVEPGEGVVEIISSGQLDAVIDVPERYISGITLGDEIEVRIDAIDAAIVGQVRAIRPDGMNNARTFPVKIRIDDPAQRLRPGMSVVASIPISKEGEFITVPRDAVLQTPSGSTVWYAMSPQSNGPSNESEEAPGGGEPDAPPADAMPLAQPPMPMAMSEPVKVLFGVGDRYAVEPLPGAPFPALNPGTQVVIEGAERLFPTRLLMIQDAGPPSASK